MDIEEMNRILQQEVQYERYHFFVREAGDRLYMQASFWAVDHSKLYGFQYVEEQFTRKWYVSRDITKSELIQTALKLVLTAAEHEVREAFKYRGKAVFGPHIDIDVLHHFCGITDARGDQQPEQREEEAIVPG